MVGAGVAGLFAAFMGQLANNGIPIDSKVCSSLSHHITGRASGRHLLHS